MSIASARVGRGSCHRRVPRTGEGPRCVRAGGNLGVQPIAAAGHRADARTRARAGMVQDTAHCLIQFHHSRGQLPSMVSRQPPVRSLQCPIVVPPCRLIRLERVVSSAHVLVGGPGLSKTTLCLRFISAGLTAGERVAMVVMRSRRRPQSPCASTRLRSQCCRAVRASHAVALSVGFR